MNTTKEDPFIRDRKKLYFSDLYFSVPVFIVLVVIGIPLSIIHLPFLLITLLWKKLFKSKSAKPLEGVTLDNVEIPDWNKRKHDLILFGATGFTGKLAAQYLATQYKGSKIRWGIAGRNEKQLTTIREQLTKLDPSLENMPIFICDSSKPDTLRQVVSITRVIASTVGPFALYGTPLVSLCAQLGTSYCDITGELNWVRDMIYNYHKDAKITGARIVNLAGFDCIPWDISTMAISKKMKSKGEELQEIHHFDYSRISPSGGTLSTVQLSFSETRKTYPNDPILQTDDGGKTDFRTTLKSIKFPTWSSEIKKWTGPSIMSLANGNAVRRSNSVLGYSKKLEYSEVDVHASFFGAMNMYLGMGFFLMALMTQPTKWILETLVLPKPGSGPSESTMDKGFLKVESIGKSDKGTTVKSLLYFPTDAGYRDTGRMLIETALSLALDSDKLTVRGGVWTPACLGDVLLERLVNTGCTFSFFE